MKDNSRGQDIVALLKGFPAKSQGGSVQNLYKTACTEMSDHPESAIRRCRDALDILEDRTQTMLYPEESAHMKGRFHILLASILLDGENLEMAEKHFFHGRDAFHSWQWCHLESLAYLGLAITQRKLAINQRKSTKLKDAFASCESAQNCVEHKSIPAQIDVTSLWKAIEEERKTQESESQELLTRIPIVSDIAAGLGRITEENTDGYLHLYDDELNGATFGVKVVGDSMNGNDIISGDIALIRRQHMVEIGEIAAVVITTLTESVGVLKKYYFYQVRSETRHWLLKSSNPLSENLVVIPSGANLDEIKNIYDKDVQSRKLRFEYYEDSELAIAGKYVGSIRYD